MSRTLISEKNDYEPYSWDITTREYEVTGELAEKIQKRAGMAGKVTMIDVDTSYGTCGACGSYGDGLKVLVDGKLVYENDRYWNIDEVSDEPTPYTVFEKWLNGA